MLLLLNIIYSKYFTTYSQTENPLKQAHHRRGDNYLPCPRMERLKQPSRSLASESAPHCSTTASGLGRETFRKFSHIVYDGWDLAEWLERLAANAYVSTAVLGLATV